MSGPQGGRVRVAIVGAGFAGIGTALRLRAEGVDSFVVLERGESVGGTWRDNRYPGVACDVPAHLYCFSFLPNPSFSSRFAPGAEIRAYLESAADPVRDRLRLGTTVEGADWAGDHWVLRTSRGRVEADALVMACGRLTEPMLPEVPGDFDGTLFHSSRWDEGVDLTAARVAVVGTGASAVQLVPHVARQAASVVVMQRTASYVLPRVDHSYSPDERTRFAERPEELAALRSATYLEGERLYESRVADDAARGLARGRALDHLSAQVADPVLHDALRPDHEFGCKRVLFSDDYYPTLAQPHVTLTGPLTAYERDGVVDAAGTRHDVDVVVLATGFHSTRQPYARLVRGRAGVSLDEHWAGGMRAYASTTVHGFPNLFVLDGPNASLSHNSAVLMIEAQIEYVLGALRFVEDGGVLEVGARAEREYATEMARRSTGRPWVSGCANAYVDPRSGRQVLLWPGRVDEFRERLAVFDPAPYDVEPVGACR
ncbi:MAG: dependent oxidoreductase [Aeromicrobium sp.]|jgi:cation diffusion facilitator CzcD-associated flavoprotein CzcO|nr:dependent oxidoreductase [Aeromicrobium sp.]